jgi:hypothetical protein
MARGRVFALCTVQVGKDKLYVTDYVHSAYGA